MKNNEYLEKRNNEGLSFWDDAFDSFFKPVYLEKNFASSMKTDVKETDKGYAMAIDVPGYDKNDITVSLHDGYLTVAAKREQSEEDKHLVRRERSFSCSRSYYVGDEVEEKDVKAKYENGTLCVFVPKKETKQPETHNITIE